MAQDKEKNAIVLRKDDKKIHAKKEIIDQSILEKDEKYVINLFSVLAINFVVIGLLFMIWGKPIESYFVNITTFNEFQIVGFFSLVLGLISYCFYLKHKLKTSEDKFVNGFLVFSIISLSLQIVILILGYRTEDPMKSLLYSNTLGILLLINIVVVFALAQYFLVSVFSVIFNKTFKVFEQSTERISVILGFFGTLITLIIKLLN